MHAEGIAFAEALGLRKAPASLGNSKLLWAENMVTPEAECGCGSGAALGRQCRGHTGAESH